MHTLNNNRNTSKIIIKVNHLNLRQKKEPLNGQILQKLLDQKYLRNKKHKVFKINKNLLTTNLVFKKESFLQRSHLSNKR